WYAFIDSAIEEQDMQIEYFNSNKKSYYSNTYTRYRSSIPLFGKNLDNLFEVASGKEMEITIDKDRHKEKKRLTFEDGDIRIGLKVEPDNEGGVFHGVTVTGSFPDLFRGQSRYYRIEDSTMSRLPEEVSRRMRSLFDTYRDGKIDMHVGRKNLKPFYREVLPRLMEFSDVIIEEKEFIESHIPPEPRFYIYIDCQDGYIICRTEGYYGGKAADPSDILTVKDPERNLPGFRDLYREDNLISVVLKYITGFDPSEKVFLMKKNDAETYDFLTDGMEELSGLGEIRATERFRRILRPRKNTFSVGVSVGSDIMNLSIIGNELTDEEVYDILSAYKRRQRFYKLKDGSFIGFEDDEALSRLSELMDSLHLTPGEFVKGKMGIPLYRALYVEKMLEDSEDLRLDRDQKFRNLIREFKSVEDADFELPVHMRKIMRGYQATGYRWMMSLDHYGFGGILADEMGLGKTMQAIAVMSSILEGADGRALVVCPASLVYNWYEEIMKYSPMLEPKVIAGSAGDRERAITGKSTEKVWITSYDLLKRDIASYEDISFRLFFIDEAQYIKNQTTAAAKSVRLISSKSRFALTGTPI
ncbi:MAG: SNF2 helicase associated domain-containing protein, partial [Lachnospiraceae bacterium]|nr:SNF2 helicase associated domain-containing protein [Lachnospiraceae bacterium]